MSSSMLAGEMPASMGQAAQRVTVPPEMFQRLMAGEQIHPDVIMQSAGQSATGGAHSGGVMGAMHNAFGSAKDHATGAFGHATGAATDAVGAAQDSATGAYGTATGAYGAAQDGATGAFGTATDAVMGKVKKSKKLKVSKKKKGCC